MMIFLLLCALLIIGAIVLCSLAWRYWSRQRSLPCPVWMRWLLDPRFSEKPSRRTRKTIELLDITPGMDVLDAGCGPGRLSLPIARMLGDTGRVTAMDIQEGMLAIVRRRAEEEGILTISLLQGGIGEGKLDHNRYDRVLLITVLGEIPDRDSALQEIYAALRPGGMLLIEETIRDPHFQRAGTVRELSVKAGFIERMFDGTRFNYTMLFQKN